MKNIIYNIAGLFIFTVCWETFSLINGGVFISDIEDILNSFITIILKKELYFNIIATMMIVLAGVSLAVILGLLCSFIFIIDNRIYLTFNLIITVIRHIPTIALFPVFMSVFGISNMARISLILLNSIPCIILSSYHGLCNVDKSLIEAGQCDGCSDLRILFAIKFPIALDELLNGISISIGNGFVAVVVAEMLGASNGLGYMIMWSNNAFNYSETYCYILILAILGVLINFVLNLFIKRYKRYIYGI